MNFRQLDSLKKLKKMGRLSSFPKPIHMVKWTLFYMNQRNSKEILFGLLEPQGDFTILEPSQIDLIHVPGLAFNTSGYRVGYGGGYYDRYLEHFPGNTISTLYPCQIQDFHPDPHDIPVEEVLIYERNF